MYCSKCGTQNPDDADFCTKCGNNLKPAPQPLTEKATVSSRGVLGTEKEVILHRIVAVIIDYIVMGFLSFFILGASVGPGLATKSPGAFIGGLFMSIILIIVIWIFYGIILETWKGQTVGKMVMGIIVVKENGEPCDFFAALLRNVFRIIDSLPTLYLVGFIVIALTEKKQRLGDRLAGTVVVKVKQ
jgi:uncharacterized RDD family membrane protein YckC